MSAEFQISNAVGNSPEALSIQINQMVYEMRRAGVPLTILSLGEAFFKIPMFDFDALDFERGYHYSDSQGVPSLRRRIANYYAGRYGSPVDGDSEVLITAGSKPAIYLSMLTALNPTDEVAIHEPCWLSYPHQAKYCGATPAFIPYDVPPEQFERFYSERTKMLIVNNPNNPGGRVYTRVELESMYEVCRRRGIYLMVDEAYSDFVLNDNFPSAATIAPDKRGIIVVNSLSKNMGMSGWRIGYVIAEPVFIRQLLKANQHVITCAPTILQNYVDTYFDQILAATLPQVKATVEKRERIAKVIDMLGLERLGGGATFYFFIGIGEFPGTSMDFAMHLLVQDSIAVVPGSAYGASTDRFVRVSIGVESDEAIGVALRALKAMTEVRDFKPYPYEQALERRLASARTVG